jgi:hypothetical protein
MCLVLVLVTFVIWTWIISRPSEDLEELEGEFVRKIFENKTSDGYWDVRMPSVEFRWYSISVP